MAKTILITGATSGIGEALAYLAADEGFDVVACGRNVAKLDKLASHANITSCKFDVTNEEQTREALADVHFDIAVLNAGTCEYVDVDSIEPAMFKRVFEPNFFGVVNAVAALKPQLKPGNQLVIVDSLARLLPFTRSQAYGASKVALYYFTKSLEVDLSKHGIHVQSVSPGFVETPLTNKNDFEMPMKITVDQAARSMLDGINAKQKSIYFPAVFAWILRALGKLPAGLQKHISLKLKQKSEQHD